MLGLSMINEGYDERHDMHGLFYHSHMSMPLRLNDAENRKAIHFK